MSTLENDIMQVARTAITDAILKNLTDYSGPLRKACEKVLDKNQDLIVSLIESEFLAIVAKDSFRSELHAALNSKLARILVDRFGGEIEKRVNELKADPTTRAKITLAIQQIVSQ